MNHFDIHGLLSVASNMSLDDYLHGFEITGQEVARKSDLSVQLGAVPDIERESRLGIMFHYNESTRELLFEYPWLVPVRVSLSNPSGDNTTLRLSELYLHLAKLVGLGFDLGSLLEAVIQMKLLIRQDLTLFHAAFVEIDGVGILLPAFANTGKTTTALTLALSNRDSKLLSDDTLILSGRGDVKSYSGFAGAGGRVLQHPNAPRLTTLERIRLSTNTAMAKLLTTRYRQPSIYLPIERWPISTTKTSKIRTIAILENGDDKLIEIDATSAIRKMMAINRHEIPWSRNPFLQTLSYLDPDHDLGGVEEIEEKLVGSSVGDLENCVVVRSNYHHAAIITRLVSKR